MSIFTVTTTADSGQGSLRSAIATATSGDTIQFSNNLAGKTITLKTGQLVLDKNLTIDGGSAPGLTVSGNQASRVFYLDKQRTATIKNLTIADGKTEGAGGGIDTRHESTITLDNVKVHNNTSELGGGMRVGHLAKATIINSSFEGNDGTLSEKYKGFSSGAIVHNESRGQLFVRNTSFENNKGFVGGAIYSFSSVSLVVEDAVFRDNTATLSEGGAIFTDGVSSKGYSPGFKDDGKIIIRRSRFEGNQSKAAGGALYLWGYSQQEGYKNDQAIIEDSVFVDNTANGNSQGSSKGGAVWVKMGLDISNSTFADNVATQQGGALWTETRLPVNISNSTFSGNEAIQDAGGAMFLNNSSTPVNITNSTIAYNKAGRANGALWFDGSHNVTLKNSIVAFNTTERDYRQSQVGYHANDGGGNIETSAPGMLMVIKDGVVADPRLGPLTEINGTLVHPLESGSPAVDAGVSEGAPKTDQRGLPRDARVDIGAFELGGTAVSEPSAPPTPPTTPTPNSPAPTPPSSLPTPSSSPSESEHLVAHLRFDGGEGGIAKDSSTNGRQNFGRLIGDADWTKGVEGGAIALDGKGDAIRLKNSKDINIGIHDERTISLRFKANEINTGDQKQVLYEEGAKVRGLNIYLDEGKLYVGGWNRPGKESGWQGTWLSTDAISADQWHRVDLVLQGGDEVEPGAIRGYIDGEEFGSGEGSQLWSHKGGTGLGSINGGTRFHDGLTPNSGSGFAGAIDEVMIFNDALSSQTIGSLV